MRYLALLALAALVAGGPTWARGADTVGSGDGWKLDAGAMTAAGRLTSYAMADGVGLGMAYEKTIMRAISRLGIRGITLDYDEDGEAPPLPESFQEYSLGLEALVGPAGTNFDPKLGGHIGYTRQDGAGSIPDANLLDVGFDLMAAMDITPKWGLMAVLTPYWLIGDDDTDYRTRGGVFIEYTIPRD